MFTPPPIKVDNAPAELRAVGARVQSPNHDPSPLGDLTPPKDPHAFDHVPLSVRETWTKWEKPMLANPDAEYRMLPQPLFEREPLSSEAQHELFAKFHQGGPEALEAFQTLVETNLRLVRHFSGSFMLRTSTTIDFADVFQEGVSGLMDAIETYDPSKGEFSTHAKWRITGAIREAIRSYSDTVHVPAHLNLVAWRILRTAEALFESIGRDPTYGEISLAAANSKSMPIVTSSLIAELFSLGILRTCPADETDHRESAPHLIPETCAPLERSAQAEELTRAMRILRESVGDFSPRELEILAMRYPLDPEIPPKTLAEVGYHLGLSGERVRQLEVGCLELLRKRLGRHGINIDTLRPGSVSLEPPESPNKRRPVLPRE